MVMNLGIVAILWFGGIRIDSGRLTQGELTAFTNYMTQILLALVVLANLIITFTKAFASANRVSEVFALEEEENGTETPSADSEDLVEFRNVSYAYEGAGDSSLKNLSFFVRRGGMLGLIGGTGSGKSTAAALIPGFYRATSGEVLVGGTDVSRCDTDALRRIIGWVPQKAVLFSGTVRENMKWRKEDATDEEIIAALKTAQAWDFIGRMPDGLNTHIADTVVSQGGKNFSGGQKQRLSIARALVGRPEILILDDSTSALDYATDLKLRQALRTDMEGTTVIMISQRTTSLKDADIIVVLDDGEAAGIGTHDQLLESCDIYREIYRSQMNEREGRKDA